MSPVRRVRRVVRKVDAWTVLKVSLIFNALLGLAFVLGSVVFWSIFVNAGIPDRISKLAELLTLSFNPDGPTLFRIALLLSIIWVVLATGFATLAALLYNLISDVVGGIEVIVLEETLAPTSQVVRPAAPKKGRSVRWPRRSKEPEPGPPPAAAPPPPAPARPAARPAAAPGGPPTEPVPAPTRPAGAPASQPRPAEPAAATQPRPADPAAPPSPNGDPAARTAAPRAGVGEPRQTGTAP